VRAAADFEVVWKLGGGWRNLVGMVLAFRQTFPIEDAIEFHDVTLLEALVCV
jgi:hypothetical protein